MPKTKDDSWPYLEKIDDARRAFIKKIIGETGFFRLLGVELTDCATDDVTLSIAYRPEICQPAGILHGGIHATLADTAVAQALRTTLREEYDIVTIEMDVKYFRPLVEGRLRVRARIVRKGRRIAHGDVDMTDDAGALIAKAWCVYAILPPKGA